MTAEEMAARIAWLDSRRGPRVGGSDMPCLVGLGWHSAADVYRDKVGDVPHRLNPSGPAARGIALESIAAAEYDRIMGVVTVPGRLCTDFFRPWMTATIDRFVTEQDGIVQIKTTAGFGDEWGPSGSDQIPPGYRIQAIHELGVTGEPYNDVFALDVIAWEPRVYRITFDQKTYDWLSEIAGRFVKEFVTPRLCPPADWQDQFSQDVKKFLPVKGSVLELGPEAGELMERRAKLKEIIKTAEGRVSEIEADLGVAFGTAELVTCPGWKVKRTPVAATEVPATLRKGYTRTTYTKLKGD